MYRNAFFYFMACVGFGIGAVLCLSILSPIFSQEISTHDFFFEAGTNKRLQQTLVWVWLFLAVGITITLGIKELWNAIHNHRKRNRLKEMTSPIWVAIDRLKKSGVIINNHPYYFAIVKHKGYEFQSDSDIPYLSNYQDYKVPLYIGPGNPEEYFLDIEARHRELPYAKADTYNPV